MAYLSPIGNEQQNDANGAPLSGGKLFFYAAGTSTAAATYTGEDGATPQANPIILNASGLPASPIWLQGGTAYKLVVKDANDVTLRTIDDISGVNDPAGVTAATEWTAYTGTPTYISATSFSVTGDQTGTFQVLRRVKTTNTGGTVYSSISASSYNAGTGLTTVTVTNDSGTLDSGLSAVAYGLLSPTNPSIPETTIGKALRIAADAAAVHTVAPIQSGTVVASTSGTSIDFTSIPSWVKRVTVQFVGVSTNGTDNLLIQIGDSGGIETTGYLGSGADVLNAGSPSVANSTAGFLVVMGATTAVLHGAVTLSLQNAPTFTWVASGATGRSDVARIGWTGGSKSLSATLDRVRITTVGGANTFDAGSINLLYE